MPRVKYESYVMYGQMKISFHYGEIDVDSLEDKNHLIDMALQDFQDNGGMDNVNFDFTPEED